MSTTASLPVADEGGATIRAWVARRVLLCVIPIWVVAAAVVAVAALKASTSQQALAGRIALHAAEIIDAELRVGLADLRVLASLPSIESRDFEGWRTLARQVRAAHLAKFVALVDSSLHVVASADLPLGGAARPLPTDHLPQVMQRRESAVSDRFVGAHVPHSMVAIAVPVIRGQGVVGRVEMLFPVERFNTSLARFDAEPITQAWLCDSQGALIASTGGQPRMQAAACPAAVATARVMSAPWTVGVDATDDMVALYFWQSQLAVAAAALATIWTAWRLAGLTSPGIFPRISHSPANSTISGLPPEHKPGTAPVRWKARHGQPDDATPVSGSTASARLMPFTLSDRESLTLLALALEEAGLGLWQFDLETGECVTTLRHDACFGSPGGFEHWTVDRLLDHVQPADRQRLQNVLQQWGTTGGRLREQFDVVWPDGSRRCVVLAGETSRASGPAVRVQGVIMELTPAQASRCYVRQRDGLESKIKRLESQAHERRMFYASTSHELRTPLNALLGFAELLRRELGPQISVRARMQLDHIATAGQQLLRLVGDVLDIVRIESGHLDLRPEDIDCGALALQVADMLLPLAEQARLELVTEVEQRMPPARLDPLRTRQILYNLLSNAIKFSGSGTRVTLTVDALEASHIRMKVQDQGHGIAPEDQAGLFQAFSQLPAGRALGGAGAGLGLALTRQLVHLQGGTIELTSDVGQGCLFTVLLPVQRPR